MWKSVDELERWSNYVLASERVMHSESGVYQMDTYFPLGRIKNSLNEDHEFKLVARFWNCDLRFRVDEDFYFMVIRDGEVESFFRGTTGLDPYTINIGGPSSVWDKMMEQPPEPFYHDWFAASFHHEFELGGDLQSAYAYYYALKRIHACMSRCCVDTKSVA